MSGEEVVFRSADLEAIWHPGDPSFLLVTFAEMGLRPNGRHWWGAAVARRIGCAALGFVAARPNWYPAAAMREALTAPRLAAVLAAHPRRLTYGFSMGGYGAIRYAHDIGAEACLAVAPQWSIDPAEVGHVERRFTRHHDPEGNAGMAIAPGQGAPRSFLVVDPRSQADAWHVARIREAVPQALQIAARGTGHETARALASSTAAHAMFAAALAGDARRLQRAVDTQRRAWARRAFMLARQTVAVRPGSALRIVARGAGLSDAEAFALRIRATEALLRQQRHREAAMAAEAILATRPDDAQALGLLADAIFALGETGRALALSHRAIALMPDLPASQQRHDRLLRRIAAAERRAAAATRPAR